ncbi:DUF4382 domain-containing protein [Halobaculum sp. D14]|uniref:DUF4382 domain-containing protein n=1 Tax=Halobaculum sp. D14 TaxID=3421642 RepID=UPI003EC05B1B
MTEHRTWAAVGAALMLLLAGCSGGLTGPSGSGGGDGTGTVNFYVSDQQNAIDQFEHLNVTVTQVTLVRAEGAANSSTDGDADANATAEAGADGQVTYDVSNVTVDLTELQGANASKLGSFGVPDGQYDKVFVYVSDVDGTLTSGESVRVKLPSSKLQITKQFTVGNGEEVDFVFDISVFKAGNSGKYVLKPVVSQSGTGDQVEIRETGDRKQKQTQKQKQKRGAGDDANETATALNASFVGSVAAGENATVSVTRNGTAVENASVRVTQHVDGELSVTTETTTGNGTATFAVAANATKLTVLVEDGDDDVELERGFGDADAETTTTDDDSGAGNGNGGNAGNGGGNGNGGNPAVRAELLG